ncbi:MAG: hypothetical protein RR234_01625 [Christensenella sp.]
MMETAYAQEAVPVVANSTAPEALTVSGKIVDNTNNTGGMSAKKDDVISVTYALSDCDWAKKADSKAILGFNLTVTYDEAVLEFVPKSGTIPSEENMLVKTNLGVDGNKCSGELLLLGAATAEKNSWEAVPGDFFDLDFKVISKTNKDVSIAIEISVSYGSFSGTIKTAKVNVNPIPKFTIDNTAPKISLDGEACTANTAKLDYSPVIVKATDETSSDVTMTLDGKAFTSGTSFDAATGVFTATDSAKNTATVTLTVDTIKLNELQNIINNLVVDVNKMDYAKTSTTINGINDTKMELSSKAQAKLQLTRYNEAVRVLNTIKTAIKALDNRMSGLKPNSIKFDSNTEINAINIEADKLLTNNNVTKSVESYQNYLNFTNATENYKTEITDKVAAVKTDLAKVGAWAYADAESYKDLSARIAALKAKLVPDTQYDAAKLKLLNENMAKSAKVDTDVADVKTLISALPAVTTVKDLAAIEKARKAYDELKTVYVLTDEQIKTIAKEDLSAKLTAAEGSVKVSQKKITDAVARIDALYNKINKIDYIKAGVETEIDNLVLLTETAAAGADRLTQDEIDALKTAYPEKITKLSSAKQDFAQLKAAIATLNDTFKTFTNITYTNKTAISAARTEYNTLKTNHSTTETMFADYGILVAAEKAIADIDAEIASVQTALTNIGAWSYGNNDTYTELRARVAALVRKQVSENTFTLTTLAEFEKKITDAQTAMTTFKTAVNVIPENPDAGDLDKVNAAKTAYKALEIYGLTDANINAFLTDAVLVKYNACLEALKASLAKIETVEKRIDALSKLYNETFINAGAKDEIVALNKITTTPGTGKDDLTQDEINALNPDKIQILAKAKQDFAQLTTAITKLNDTFKTFTNITYTNKTAISAARTEYNTLKTNHSTTETMFADYGILVAAEKAIADIDAEIASVQTALTNIGAWSYGNNDTYTELRARVAALVRKQVSENTFTLTTLAEFEKKITDAQTAMTTFKTAVNVIPENPDAGSLNLVKAAETAYLKLEKDFNLSTTDINKYLNEATTIKTYKAAVKALADSLAKIEAVEKRIAALYNGADIIYGKTEEMKVLASILDGTYTGTDKLTAVEIGAVKAESKTQLSEAPDKVKALIKSIDDLNAEMHSIKQASYKVKADATALRTRLTALNTANKVPVDTATFKDLDNLIKTEKFIADIEKEMVSVKAAYAAIPSKDTVKVTQKEELETLNTRYDALLKLDVTAEQIGADTKRYTDALAGIDKVWDDVKALDKAFLKLPTAEKTLYTDKKQYNETVLELERITARGVEQTDVNYTNYSKYTAFKDAFLKLQGKVDNMLLQISSIKPWKYGNNSVYSKLINDITSLKVFGIEITDLPTAAEIKVAQDMQNAAEIIVDDICAKAKVLPASVTRADKAAVDAIAVQMDKLRAAPYSMPDKDLKMAINNKYGTDIFTKIAQAIVIVNTPVPAPEPAAPAPKPKPNKKPVVNKDNNNDNEQPVLKAEGETNITLQPTKGVELPKGVKLIANEIKEEDQKDFMEKAKSSIQIIGEELDGTVGKIAMFDISLELNGKKIQPNGKVQITIAVPKGFDGKKIVVFYVSDDGKAEKLEAIVKDGKIIFETDHFSYYSIVELTVEKEASSASSSVETAASEKPASSQAEITEHSNNLVIIIALVVALAVVAMLVVIVIIRKRNNPQ